MRRSPTSSWSSRAIYVRPCRSRRPTWIHGLSSRRPRARNKLKNITLTEIAVARAVACAVTNAWLYYDTALTIISIVDDVFDYIVALQRSADCVTSELNSFACVWPRWRARVIITEPKVATNRIGRSVWARTASSRSKSFEIVQIAPAKSYNFCDFFLPLSFCRGAPIQYDNAHSPNRDIIQRSSNFQTDE